VDLEQQVKNSRHRRETDHVLMPGSVAGMAVKSQHLHVRSVLVEEKNGEKPHYLERDTRLELATPSLGTSPFRLETLRNN